MEHGLAERRRQRSAARPARPRLFAAGIPFDLAVTAHPVVRPRAPGVAYRRDPGGHPRRGGAGAPCRRSAVSGLGAPRRAARRRLPVARGVMAAPAAAAQAGARADDLAMAELRNYEGEVREFQFRIGVAGFAVLIAFGLLAARFVFLQVLQHEHYAAKAEDNRIAIVPLPPVRGLILDRNGVVLARNYSGYTLEIYPRRVRSIDDTIEALSELVEITGRDRARFRKLLAETRNAESLPIRSRLSDEEVAR